MATTRGTRTTSQSKRASFGLLASGTSGPWEVAIDETTSGATRWYVQVEGPSVTFYFEVHSLDIVDKMLQFLEPRREMSPNGSKEKNCSLGIGKDKKAPITLVNDDEYGDRFFIVVGPTENPTVRFAVAGTDATQIIDALRQVKEDLSDNG
jgi:hypothetical protein